MLVGLQFGRQPVDFGAAAAPRPTRGETMWTVTTTTVDSLVKLFYDKEARDQVSGVVGSYEATRQSFEFDTKQAVYVLALISLSLGIINLFPFLPLDGGHIFWALAEKVRGKPIPFRIMERAGRRRLHARDVPVLHRPVERHRADIERRGLRRALSGAGVRRCSARSTAIEHDRPRESSARGRASRVRAPTLVRRDRATAARTPSR